jgi:DNA polymerase III subunit alpha
MARQGSYVNLHTHSTYSTLDGFSRVEEYVDRAKALGMPAIALTDHGNVSGWLDLIDATETAGIKPLFGSELYQSRKTRHDRDPEELARKVGPEFEQRGPYHLTVLSRSDTGYRNLIKLSSRSYLEGWYDKPRIDHELLSEHGDGLIVLSGCLGGEVCQALLRDDFSHALEAAAFFQDAVGKDNFYIEVMNHDIPEERAVTPALLEIATKIGARVVPTCDSHYADPADSHKHDFSLCVATSATLDKEDRFKFQGTEFHLRSYDEMATRFEPEWLANTLLVGESVECSPDFGNVYFPDFPLPPGQEAEPYFEGLVWEGLRRRYGDPLSEAVVDRATYELRVIKAQGFINYFLVVSDVTTWADTHGVRRGPGRGSAAASIAGYALGITNLDPLYYKLPFERFLVEGRKSPPDIDLDFDDRTRDKVIGYVREKYGSDRVTNICTFNRIGARQAIRDSARVHGFTYSEGDKVAKLVPAPIMGFSSPLADAVESPELEALIAGDETSRVIVDSAFWLEGLIRQTGVHPAGVVITPTTTTDFIPVMQRGPKKPVVTQWDMHGVELAGQLKIDFLGLRTLGTLDLCLEMLGEGGPTLESIPLDDSVTYRTLCSGQSKGVFQLEGGPMTELTVALAPDCIEDLMALVALYRPGPMGSGMDKLYVERKHGREETTPLHPKLEPVLRSTYQIILYQEDVLAVARTLAGFDPLQSDDLRKAIGKKMPAKIALFRELFVEGCSATSDVAPRVSNSLYTDIEHHGAYSFNRAHAASYALIAYWTAYCKVHFPDAYMAALLSTVTKDREKTGVYLRECRRLGIEVLPPQVGRSRHDFTVTEPGRILYGYRSIRGIGPAVANPLGAETRLYDGVDQFLREGPVSALDRDVFERLVHSGALDELAGEELPQGVASREARNDYLRQEYESLSAYVSEHPMAGVLHLLGPHVTAEIVGLAGTSEGVEVVVAGVVTGMMQKRSKKGNISLFFDLEDLSGTTQVYVFPRDVARVGHLVANGAIVLVTGRVAHEGDEEQVTRLLFRDLTVPELPDDIAAGPPVWLKAKDVDHTKIARMASLIAGRAGDSPLYLEVGDGRHTLVFRYSSPVSAEMQAELEEIVG